MSHRAWQAPNSRGKGKEERSRSAGRERRLRGGRVGEFRPCGEYQEQGEWSGGASHSAVRQQLRGERGRETETTPPKWHGQQQGGRSSTIRSPGRTRQRERRDSSWSRSPDGQHSRREKYAGERSPWRQPRTWSEHLDAWSPSPERQLQREMSRWEEREVHGPPTVQWGRTEGRGESRERRYEAGGSRQKRRTEGRTLVQGAERAGEAREGMQRARAQLRATGLKGEAEAGMYAEEGGGEEVEQDVQCALMAWRGREEMGLRSGERDGRREQGRSR
ncbi:unnamed protein product [Closterium sp. NIES-64]|nr:unnamed protein product [Closterium sp. NIES-64]